MEIPLRYGAGSTVLRVPRRNVAAVVGPAADREAAAIHPASLEKFRECVRGKRALLLIPDGTRRASEEALLTALSALVPCGTLSVVVATGSHRPDTPANRELASAVLAAAAQAGLPAPDLEVHDCRAARFLPAGTTPRGNPLRLSARLADPEVVLVVSEVKHHYFAGYSNPLKFFLPGVADFATIEANHRFALDPDAAAGRHPLHPDATRRTNPVAEEMLAAFRQVRGDRDVFALTSVEAHGRTVHADLDELEAATSRALAAADDAEVLLLAECKDGIADSDAAFRNFYVELSRPLDEIVERIRSGYRLYQHKAYKFAELLLRIRKLHLVSALTETDVRAGHFEPASSAQGVVDRWIHQDPQCGIVFLDEANRLAVIGDTP